jgi:3-oxoacyl-[acyl-carrier-protein] synthase II
MTVQPLRPVRPAPSATARAPAGSTDLVVTGIGVTCPATDEPAKLLDEGTGPDPGRTGEPSQPWFDVRSRLRGRGYKYLPPACHYLLVAARAALVDAALADAGDAFDQVPATGRGIVVGTNCATAALHHDMDRTVIESSADDLSPALAPFFSINLIAGRLSMEHAVKGFNLTLNTPRLAGLEAIQASARAVAAGRAGLVLAGATEAEPAEAGAVVLALQPRAASGGRSYGHCTVRTQFVPPRSLQTRHGRLGALERVAGLVGRWTEQPALHIYTDGSPVGALVSEALRRATGRDQPVLRPGAGCLTPLLRVAGLLANGHGTHLVIVATAEGHLGVAEVRCWPREPARTIPRSPGGH